MAQLDVVRFFEAVARDARLNREVCAAARTPAAWSRLATDAGYDVSAADLARFVATALGRDANLDNAVDILLEGEGSARGELSDADLATVAGGENVPRHLDLTVGSHKLLSPRFLAGLVAHFPTPFGRPGDD